MKATETLHDRGQSLWLDNITRDLLTTGTLERYIDELSVTGLTSNPTIFDRAIESTSSYDDAIAESGKQGEEHDQGCCPAPFRGRSAEPVHQDSRHVRGPARDRGGDLRRRPGERHAVVRRRAVPGGRRGVRPRH